MGLDRVGQIFGDIILGGMAVAVLAIAAFVVAAMYKVIRSLFQ